MKKKVNFLVFTGVVMFLFATVLLIQGNSSPVSLLVEPVVLGEVVEPLLIPETYVDYGMPEDLIVLSDGNIWYVDSQGSRVMKVSPSGVLLRSVGGVGTNLGRFSGTLSGITKGLNDHFFVLTYDFVYELDSNGAQINMFGVPASAGSSFLEPRGIEFDERDNTILVTDQLHNRVLRFSSTGDFISEFGGAVEGGAPAIFNRPAGITTDASGKIYVVDCYNHQVQVFSSTGVFDFSFGTEGLGTGQFYFPKDVAITSTGDILVTSQNSQKMLRFNSAGVFVEEWGSNGTEAWQWRQPQYIALDASDNVYVSDVIRQSIQKFSLTGTYISAIRNSGNTGANLTSPSEAQYDSAGDLYVLDFTGRVNKYTNAGVYMGNVIPSGTVGYGAYHLTIDGSDRIYVSDEFSVHVFNTSGTELFTFGSAGSGDGQFLQARGIAVDSLGNIYVSDIYQHRIQKFTSAGVFISAWGTYGNGNGQLMFPEVLLFDDSDVLYVADNSDTSGGYPLNTRIQKFSSSGVFDSIIVTFGYNDDQVELIGGMAFDSTGALYVSDTGRHKVKVFDSSGVFASAYGENGSGFDQYNEPHGVAFDTNSDSISVVDGLNHRVTVLTEGYRIKNLNDGNDVVKISEGRSVVNGFVLRSDPERANVQSYLTFGDYVVSDFVVDLTSDRDWSNVGAVSLADSSKALIVSLSPAEAPGVSATHSLFIPKLPNQSSVYVCPEAAVLSDVSTSCTNGYSLVLTDPELSLEMIDGREYWKVTGLTGTGIMSESSDPTPTLTPTPSTTVTPTVTPVPTPTITPTPTNSPTVISVYPVAEVVDSLQETVACPKFESFSADKVIAKVGDKVTISWVTTNTEIVTVSTKDVQYNPVDSFVDTMSQTTEYTLTADNGKCSAEQSVIVQVVDVLPWVGTSFVGAGVALFEVTALALQPAVLTNAWYGLVAVFDRKKKRSWGVVFNTKTNKPVSRAIIRLIDNETKDVSDTTVSDINGVFSIRVKKGKYTINVTHPDYKFPTALAKDALSEAYANPYMGEVITIKESGKPLEISLPLDEIKSKKGGNSLEQMKQVSHRGISLFANIFLVGGLLYSGYEVLVHPYWLNSLIFGVYIFFAGLKYLLTKDSHKNQGKALVYGSKLALPGIELGLFDAEFDNLLYRTFSSDVGEYFFLVSPGVYNLKVLDTNYKLSDNQGNELELLSVNAETTQDGPAFIGKDLLLKK